MQKKYPFVVEGKDFKILDNDTVKIIKKTVGKIPQGGIRKFGDDAYVLQSDTVHDILDAPRNKGWAHSSSFLAKKGMIIYVVPNKDAVDTYGVGAVGVKFEATTDTYEDTHNTFVWASE